MEPIFQIHWNTLRYRSGSAPRGNGGPLLKKPSSIHFVFLPKKLEVYSPLAKVWLDLTTTSLFRILNIQLWTNPKLNVRVLSGLDKLWCLQRSFPELLHLALKISLRWKIDLGDLVNRQCTKERGVFRENFPSNTYRSSIFMSFDHPVSFILAAFLGRPSDKSRQPFSLPDI